MYNSCPKKNYPKILKINYRVINYSYDLENNIPHYPFPGGWEQQQEIFIELLNYAAQVKHHIRDKKR